MQNLQNDQFDSNSVRHIFDEWIQYDSLKTRKAKRASECAIFANANF